MVSTGPTETGKGSFTIGLKAGNSLVNYCPPKVSCIMSDRFNIPYILPEIFLLQPKINKNDESQVVLIENGQHYP